MVFQPMKIPSELKPSERRGQTWSEVGLLDVGSMARFRQLLEEKGWQAGRRDAKGQTLSGALIWKVLLMRKQVRSADPMTSWLRQLRAVLETEAPLLSMEERWWAKALKETSFVRYAAWHAPFRSVCGHLRHEDLKSVSCETPALLRSVLESTSSLMPQQEWAFQEPLAHLWRQIQRISWHPFPESREEVKDVLALLAMPGVDRLSQTSPSEPWEWTDWAQGKADRWRMVLEGELGWQALRNTGVGSSFGTPARNKHDGLVLQQLVAIMGSSVEHQELEKLLAKPEFLPRLKACWQRSQWEGTWETTPQVPRGPRF